MKIQLTSFYEMKTFDGIRLLPIYISIPPENVGPL